MLVGGFGRGVSGDGDLGDLHVWIGSGIADGILYDGELCAVVDALPVLADVGLRVKLGLVNLELHSRLPFMD